MPGIVIPASELRVSFARSGGPGGQNVNKVESKVLLRWSPAASAVLSAADRAWLLERLAKKLTADGDLIVTADRTRDQGRNREDAEARLHVLVNAALVRPKRRRKTRPSAAAREKRVDAKKARGRIKQQRQRGGEE